LPPELARLRLRDPVRQVTDGASWKWVLANRAYTHGYW